MPGDPSEADGPQPENQEPRGEEAQGLPRDQLEKLLSDMELPDMDALRSLVNMC
jgi:hypothetical protein